MKPIIQLQNVHVVYDQGKESEVAAIRDASLEIFPGEYIIFFGPSGSGKSTLLYTIAGLESATAGSVEVHGHELHAISEKEMIAFHRSTIGMIFQAFYLIPHYTVLDNIALPFMFTDTTRQQRESKAHALIERFGLSAISEHTPTQMSGGQQQRTAIARALMNDPQIILADEPVGNLDTKNAAIVLDLLARVNAEEHRTIIQVTHNAEDLVYADRIFHMRDGRIEKIEQNLHKKGLGQIEMQPPRKPERTRSDILAEHIAERLLRPYSRTTEEIIKKAIERFVSGEINREELQTILDREKSGAGLNAQTARRLAKEIEEMAGDTRRASVLAAGSHTQHVAEMATIRAHLVAPYHPHLTDTQKKRLDEAVRNRLEGKLTAEAFFERLDASQKSGGVGLNRQSAHAIAEKLESILHAQT